MSRDYCPNCGAGVPVGARACPECGSDERTGWSEDAHAQQLGLPDESFNYESFVKEEFAEPTDDPIRPAGVAWFWWGVAVAMLAVLLAIWRH